MKHLKLFTLVPISWIFLACTAPQPQVEVHNGLEKDKQKLLALNAAYQTHEIDGMTYLKEYRVLNAKIHGQEDNSDDSEVIK